MLGPPTTSAEGHRKPVQPAEGGVRPLEAIFWQGLGNPSRFQSYLACKHCFQNLRMANDCGSAACCHCSANARRTSFALEALRIISREGTAC